MGSFAGGHCLAGACRYFGAGIGAWPGAQFAFRLERRNAKEDREAAARAAAKELSGRRAAAGHQTPTRGTFRPLRALGARRPIVLHKLGYSVTYRQFCDIVGAHRGRGPTFPSTRCDKMFAPVRRMIEEGRRGSSNQGPGVRRHLASKHRGPIGSAEGTGANCRSGSVRHQPADVHGHDRFASERTAALRSTPCIPTHGQSRGSAAVSAAPRYHRIRAGSRHAPLDGA